MVETIFSSPLAFQVILPFLLVFTLVFAVLDKSEVLGKDKRRINALVALIIGLIVVAFGRAVYIINNMIPFLAVSLVIILVFMILVGALYEQGSFKLSDNVKWILMIVIAIAVIIASLYFTGAWDYLYSYVMSGGSASTTVANILFIVLIVVAVAFVFWGAKSGDKKS